MHVVSARFVGPIAKSTVGCPSGNCKKWSPKKHENQNELEELVLTCNGDS
jgi:hypothetical protein